MAGNDTRFEYRVIHLKPTLIGGIGDEVLQNTLNDAGREGWALVQIVHPGNADLGMRLVLQRAR